MIPAYDPTRGRYVYDRGRLYEVWSLPRGRARRDVVLAERAVEAWEHERARTMREEAA